MGAAELLVPVRKVVLEPKSQEKRGAGASESAAGEAGAGWRAKDEFCYFIWRSHQGSAQWAPADVCVEFSKGKIAKGQTLHPDSNLY